MKHLRPIYFGINAIIITANKKKDNKFKNKLDLCDEIYYYLQSTSKKVYT